MARMKRKPKWKIVFLKKAEPVYLYDFRNLVTCFQMRWRETFDVYKPEAEEWLLVYTHHPIKVCGCGRSYNGFRMRDSFLDSPKTEEQQVAWMHKPVLCEFCFYKRQHGAGNWIPRKVRAELGLEN